MLASYANLPRTVYTICVGMFINRAGTMLYPFLTLYLTQKMGWSASGATAAVSALGAGAIGATLTGGHLADVVGRRFVMLSALFGGASALVVLIFLERPWAIVTCLAVFSFLAEMYRPAAGAMLADLVEPKRRAHAYSLNYLAINLGFCVAPLIGGVIIARGDFSLLLVVDAATTVCFGLVILFGVRETLDKGQKADGGSPSGDGHASEADTGFLGAMAHIIRDRVFVIYGVATLCIALVFMQSLTTLPLYLQSRGIGAEQYGRIIAVNGAMIVLFQIPLTERISRMHRGTVICLASVITAAGFGLTSIAVAPWHFVATVIVWTLGEMMAAPTSMAVAADLAPKRLRARYMGVFTMSFSAGNVLGVPLGGLVLANFGGPALWLGALGVGAVSTLLFLSIRGPMALPESDGYE